MKYHSRRKVNRTKKMFINFMYKIGIPVMDIKEMVGVSRATVYRHLNKLKLGRADPTAHSSVLPLPTNRRIYV